MQTSVVSTFEGGYQPLTAISAVTSLAQAGHSAELVDTYVEGDDVSRFSKSQAVAISVPLFDSLRAGIDLAGRIRSVNPTAPIIFFGQYATINAERLSKLNGDFTVVGEWEKALAALITHLDQPSAHPIPASVVDYASSGKLRPSPDMPRDHFRLPYRNLAPALHKYPQPQIDRLLGGPHIVGGLEATRGCHHRCTYCSVFAAYDGKVLVIGDDIVIEDATNLVAMGMTHLSFTDAEFFNTKRNGIRILRELHRRFPKLTYDFTTRVDHIIEHQDILSELSSLGVRFITSALEFPKQSVLDHVAKEVSLEMIDEAIALLRTSGIRLNPTFIMFNPWIDLEDIIQFEDFVSRNALEEVIDPIQFETRLHLYKGSPLLRNPTIQALALTEHEFHYEWAHPDPRVDELYRATVTPVEEGVFKRCCLKC